MNVKKQLGTNVKLLRKASGLSQEALANQIEMSPAHLRSIEHGRANPTLMVLERIAIGLGTTISALVAENDGSESTDDNTLCDNRQAH